MRIRPVLLTVAGAAALVPLVRAAHRAQLGCGATATERIRTLPGDGLVPVPDLVATRAIDIDAPPAAVWPWLVQLGQGRAGFYSYDVLENLLGLEIHSSDRIVPEWQDLAVGDPVNLAEGVPLAAAIVEPDAALVLFGAGPLDPDDEDDAPPYDFSWAFVVEPRDGGTRLLVRERYAYRVSWAPGLVLPVSWISWLMTQRMLRGIRDRAGRD
ncbi:SRPBCC family protein [Actinotalea sp. M2MS4P-6]|uniref:SRPBCC family protein n=1 Tax=Actinotalea sp. M2MS4P-6 TaxID=2983762 RepID=UPI0021E36A03|nr:SRPBCC family protein [Actinotalea sp. M2MS4P-6]MCV2393213.1 SRPBCC family protein [Actinotalea sp. M2MS4P-6]